MRKLCLTSCALAMAGCLGAAPSGIGETAEPIAVPRPTPVAPRLPVCMISWITTDDFLLNGTDSASASAVLSDPASGNVYAAGSSSGHWIVRSSADRGATWSIIDDFVYGAMAST